MKMPMDEAQAKDAQKDKLSSYFTKIFGKRLPPEGEERPEDAPDTKSVSGRVRAIQDRMKNRTD